jgi:hypothetical protein
MSPEVLCVPPYSFLRKLSENTIDCSPIEYFREKEKSISFCYLRATSFPKLATLLLLSCGLVGLNGFRRKFRKQT